MIGVYKITNQINGNSYIGCSTNIEQRLKTHFLKPWQKSKEYNYPLYRAIRKYGKNIFTSQILEECAIGELEERERYWISYYNTFDKGYNQTPGGNLVHFNLAGENHPNHKLTEIDVMEIRERWASQKESVRDIWIDFQYKIKKTGFKKIYTWQTWKNILPELNTEANRIFHRKNTSQIYSNQGSFNGRALLTEQQVKEIRIRKQNGEQCKQVFEDFKYTTISYGSFNNVWVGMNWKHVII